MEKCPRCLGSEFWILGTGQYRCKQCKLTRFPVKTYWQYSQLSPYLKAKLLDYFCLGVPAYRLRFQLNISLKAIQRFYRILRVCIYDHQFKYVDELSGSIEVDETLFGGKRPGKRGWGAEGKILVFGMYKRNGLIVTFPVSSRGRSTLLPLIQTHSKPGSLFYTDDWHAYASLSIHGGHVVVTKKKGVPRGRSHINSIEGFWSYAKHWLYQYRGVHKLYFPLYLKEIEWRFNHRKENLIKKLRSKVKTTTINHELVQFWV